MVSPDVWDAKHPTGRPSGGLEIDVSVVTRPFDVQDERCGEQSYIRYGGGVVCPLIDNPVV
jgi:hypothetical protein